MIAREEAAVSVMRDGRWRIELLGGLRVTRGGAAGQSAGATVARFPTQKTALLLAHLAFYVDREHSRGVLTDLLWPDADLPAGCNSLSQALFSLRRALRTPGTQAPSILLADRHSVRLNPDAVTTDVAEFEAALQAVRCAGEREVRHASLTAAVERYAGPLLAGYHDSWILLERERLAEAYFGALRQLIAALEATGDPGSALQYAYGGVRSDPLREEAHHELIRLQFALDQPAAALRQYHELERLLRDELDDTPSPATRALVRDLTARVDLSPAPPARPHLPAPLTRFFGREDEIAQLGALLRRNVSPPASLETQRQTAEAGGEPSTMPRLVTLTGPGGSGKTRLALTVAERVAEAWSGAVFFAPLVDHGEPSHVSDAIRDALGLPRTPGVEPLEQVVAALSRRPTLLLLDNFEHLLEEGAPLIGTLLQGAPMLTLLVTSRRRLDLSGEREFPVAPLPVPVEAEPGARWPSSLMNCPSVQLFVDRARAVCLDFRVTEENAAAVAAVCARLEGIPLALELAAARASVLSPAEMVPRLERRFDFLVSGRRDAEARHRTLHAAIDWSYRLLTPELQRFFARLCVFRGGWTLGAAEAVCDEARALEFLEQLRAASLGIAEERGGETRFRMLETLREFAREQLAPQELAALQRRHAEYYLALAEEGDRELWGPGYEAWTERLTTEHDNLRAALAWSRDDPHAAEIGLRLVAALWWFWHVRDHVREGRGWIEGALAKAEESCRPAGRPHGEAWRVLATPADGVAGGATNAAPWPGYAAARAKALCGLGEFAWVWGEQPHARTLLKKSIALFREVGEGPDLSFALSIFTQVARALSDGRTARWAAEEAVAVGRRAAEGWALPFAFYVLAQTLHDRGEYAAARAAYQESLALSRAIGNPWLCLPPTYGLGQLARDEGDLEAARSWMEESLGLARRLKANFHIGNRLRDLGAVLLKQGDDRQAEEMFAESLVLSEELGAPSRVAESLDLLARVALARCDTERARSLLIESLSRWRQLGDRLNTAGILRALADLAQAEQAWACAARLLAAAEALRETTGAPTAPARRARLERAVADLRAALGEEAFAAAWEAGRKTSLEQLLADLFPRPSSHPPPDDVWRPGANDCRTDLP
jgi:predicted ATPase/DNA-binding SARP family transcriptional activator